MSESVSLRQHKKRRTKQLTLEETAAIVNDDALDPAIALLFAYFSWPHHAADSAVFINALDRVRASQRSYPGSGRVRAGQLTLAQELRGRIVRQLRNYCRSSALSIAIDGWTNVNKAKVTNVVILCGSAAYYWCSIVNGTDRNTAAWLTEPLRQVLDGLRAEGLIFSALVADNESVNTALWERLLLPFPFLVRSPCAAHIIQLCVHKALELSNVDALLKSVEALLAQFRYKEARLKLKALQVAGNSSGVSLNLVRPCDTRWSSWLYAVQRLLLLQQWIDVVMR